MRLLLLFCTLCTIIFTQPTLPPHYTSSIEVSQVGRNERYRGVFVFDSIMKRWRLDVVFTFNSNTTLMYVDSWRGGYELIRNKTSSCKKYSSGYLNFLISRDAQFVGNGNYRGRPCANWRQTGTFRGKSVRMTFCVAGNQLVNLKTEGSDGNYDWYFMSFVGLKPGEKWFEKPRECK